MSFILPVKNNTYKNTYLKEIYQDISACDRTKFDSLFPDVFVDKQALFHF